MTSWLEVFPTIQPFWPLSFILAAAAAITVLTFWTYAVAARRLTARQRIGLWALRMLALLIAVLVLVRPTWELRHIKRLPAKLVVLVDSSKSMLVTDEEPRQRTRYAAAVSEWHNAHDLIKRLEEENVRFIPLAFDTRLRDWKPEEEPAGDATGMYQALDQALEMHRSTDAARGEVMLGMVLFTDGRDNVGKPPLDSVASKLARLPCPVHTIGMGQPGGAELQPDLVAQSIDAPQSARVKDKLTVRGVIQAQRFENQPIEVWLMLNGEPATDATIGEGARAGRPVRVVVRPTKASEMFPIEFPPCILPDKPGDYRLSLKIKPLPGELTETNNEVSTYITLTKEGLSVLYLDKERAYEPKFLRRVLRGDERITLIDTYLGDDQDPAADRLRNDLASFIEKNSFDVFVIGDIPASRFARSESGKAILKLIEQKVSTGAGFMMIGGHNSFAAGGWANTSLAPLIPVDMTEKGQLEGEAGGNRPVKFVPTEKGLSHFSLRLDLDAKANAEWWARLAPLDGGSRLGRPQRTASILAESPEKDVLLAVAEFGAGRTAALAVDTTWRWIRPGPARRPDPNQPEALSEGSEAHLRFWRQMILWLAKQEDTGKNLRIELGQRRLTTGKEQNIAVQARKITPGGTKDQIEPIAGAQFQVTVIRPNKAVETIEVTPDNDGEARSRGIYWKTDEPGEYEVVATARYQNQDLGEARSRFMAVRDDSELVNRSANHAVLEQIAAATGGTHRLHGGFRDLLEDLARQSARDQVEITPVPNWREPHDWLQGGLVLVFVLLITIEWLLRRAWGLV
jgi:uncharacterized membrane protein